MRELTFKGFLTSYVKQLSTQNTNDIYKLVAEAKELNPRLREPLFLYALYMDKVAILMRAAKDTSLYPEYSQMYLSFDADAITKSFQSHSSEVRYEYHKVWKSFTVQRDRLQADDHTKELIRQKVQRLQAKTGVTNYRIYTDLKLNPGNINAWLKHGDAGKVSLETARRTLKYVENAG